MFNDVQALHQGLQLLEGSFAPNAALAIDATTRLGVGFTVARVGVGVYRLTLSEVYAQLVSAKLLVQLSAFADTNLHLGAVDLPNRTIDIRVSTAGVAAEIAANANNRVHFSLALRSTTRNPNRT